MKGLSKFITSLVFSMLMISSAFAAGGIMAGEGDIHMVQTKWFDIIYGDAAEKSAAVLYQNADQIYQDLADMYGWENPPVRMPVVLTTQVEVFNAYFSTGNYNHIVLYVTNPSEDLANQPDTFLWTFRHELTHAFTYNVKSKITCGWTAVFGDASTFHTFCVTPGVAEGATLTSESYEGNGRLNDEFAKQYVKQAKLERKFPKYSDVQGSRDIYPLGSYYYFNGAFHEYLQEHYGLEKYASFWYNCINNSVTTAGAFKKAYGLKLRKEWAKFKEEYKIPAIPSDPLLAGSAQDFYTPNSNSYSLENKKGNLAASLSQSEKGLVYFDESTYKIFFVDRDDLQKDEILPKELFQYFYVKKVTQSTDGKYITLSYSDKKKNYRIAIYNTETKNWYEPKYHGVKEGIVVKQGDDYYLSVLAFKGEQSEVKITKLNTDFNGDITGESESLKHEFSRTELTSSFTPVKDGIFAFIMNNRLNYSICLMDIDGNLLSKIQAPVSKDLKHYIMHYLSVNNNNPDEIYFSWVSEGTMPRVGKLNIADFEYTLSLEDLSGGIYYPVKYNDELIYVGKFYEFNKMFKKTSEFNVKDKIIAKTDEKSKKNESFLPIYEISENDLIPSINNIALVNAYNPLRYLRGTFIPVSSLKSTSYDSVHRGSYYLPLGITFITNNPWDSLTYTCEAGWGPETNSAAFSFTVNGTNGGENFGWKTSALAEFDYKGFKAGEAKVSTSLTGFAKNTTFSLSPSLFFHGGRSNASLESLVNYPALGWTDYLNFPLLVERFSVYGNQDDLFYLFGNASVLLSVNNIRRFYNNRYSQKGYYLGLLPAYYHSYDLTNNSTDYNYGDVTLFGEYCLPRLINIDCEYGKTYNLPVRFFAAAFSTASVYSKFVDLPLPSVEMPTPELAMFATEILLFGKEFQESFSFLPIIFTNNVSISFVGALGFDYLSHRTDNFGFIYVQDFTKEIFSGENKLMGVFAFKFNVGMNFLNFGALARYSNKSNISIIPTLTFTSFDSAPKYKTNFGFEFNF